MDRTSSGKKNWKVAVFIVTLVSLLLAYMHLSPDSALTTGTAKMYGEETGRYNINNLNAKNTFFINKDITYVKDSYKTPCFYDSNKTFQCLPYAFVLGMPKSGSTDIFCMMKKHPTIESTRKEVHWWTRGRFERNSTNVIDRPLDTYYVRFFATASQRIINMPDHIIVDPSPSTLWDNDYWSYGVNYTKDPGAEPPFITADYIKHLLPNSKFAAILRDPVTRLFSGYRFFKGKREKTSEQFHMFASEAVYLMTQCIKNYGERSCVYNANLNKRLKVRLRIGMYVIYLEDWFKVFDRKQFFIIQLEEYSHRRSAIMHQLCKFLNISDYPQEILDSIDRKQAVNSNARPNAVIKLWNDTEHLLRKFYQPYNDRLARLLNDTKFTWK